MSAMLSGPFGVLSKRLKDAGRKIATGSKRSMVEVVASAEREVATGFSGFEYGARPTNLMARSGTLRRSVRGTVTGNQVNEITGKLRAAAPYARVQEFGREPVGSSTGKRYWTLPLKPALTRAGVLRKPITAYTDGFFMKTRKGRLMFAREVGRGKRSRLEFLFALFPFPTPRIPPRLGMGNAVRARRPILKEKLLKVMTEAIGGAVR